MIDKGSVWRHKEKKTIYEVLNVGKAEMNPGAFVPVVSYMNTDGDIFFRKLTVFLKRFELVSFSVGGYVDHLLTKIEELERLCFGIREDLLGRSETDSDGIQVVNLSDSLWQELRDLKDVE